MNGRKSNKRLPLVYDYTSPDRVAFIEKNAVALVRSRDALIDRLRERIRVLESANDNLRGVRQRNKISPDESAYEAWAKKKMLQ